MPKKIVKKINVKYLKAYYIKDYFTIIIGIILYAVGFTVFILPNKIVTGGLAGVASIIRYGTGFEVWKSTLIINLILLLIAYRVVNKQFVVRTVVGSGLLIFALLLGENYLFPYFSNHPPITDPFLSAIMGGIFVGAGLGLVYSSNGSTGGTDIVAFLATKYFRISIARVLLIADVIIVSSSYLILETNEETLEKTVLGLILLPVMYQTVDMVMNGARQSVQLFIFSKKYEEIATHINAEVRRGCTIVDGMGWYSKEPQKIIIVIARRTEAKSIFRLVDSIDPDAFVTKTNVEGVYGKGFDKLR